MKTFAELEKEHHRVAVKLKDADNQGSGFLVLEGKDTTAIISSSQHLGLRSGDNGWFDVSLRASNGRGILLHNAIMMTSSINHHNDSPEWEAHLFPNYVLFNSDVLQGGRIKSLSFQLENLASFFHYQTIEWQPLFDATQEGQNALKVLRRRPGRSYDFFKPRDVYIVHRPPRVLSFKTGGRTYSVYVGVRSQGLGWNHTALDAVPVACIDFSEPVSVDDAMQAIWDWKRFFSILGMNPMPLTAIAAGGSTKAQTRDASFYLPSYKNAPTARKGMFSLNPSSAPLNLWKDRKRLSHLMKSWLQKSGERAFFRGAVGNTIDDLSRRISLNDVATLCAGIETLSELDDASPISKEDLALITAAARKAVVDHSLPVSEARVGSVLAMLRWQSLPQRLRLMFEALGPAISIEDAERLKKSVLELRNMAAHGQGYADVVMPRVEPTASALMAVCALYDLMTCGLDPKASAHARRLEWAIAGLRQTDGTV